MGLAAVAVAAPKGRRVSMRKGREYRYTVEWENLDDESFERLRGIYSAAVKLVRVKGNRALVYFDHVAEEDETLELPEPWKSGTMVLGPDEYTSARWRVTDVRPPEV